MMANYETYIPMVHTIAGRLHQGPLKMREYDELVGDGMVGLVKAGNGFDPEYGVNFATYARKFVRGAMIDGVRSQFGRTKRRPTSVPLVALGDNYSRDFADDVDPALELKEVCSQMASADEFDKACFLSLAFQQPILEVAERFNTSTTTVSRRRRAIRSQLIGMR
jgi:RNA polymerase sigma factor (sigma-70 family)